jgi:hypothetical protein
VLVEQDRVVVVYRGEEHALRVVGGRRHHDLQAGDVDEPGLQGLGVLGGGAGSGASGGADYHRDPSLAAEHVPDLGRLVDELVHAVGYKVRELQLGYRAHPHERRTRAQPDVAGLGDGRVHHALLAELLDHAPAHAERAAVDADVLAHEEDLGFSRMAPTIASRRASR